MNRFIKKEWEDTEIPDAVLKQARDRAWSRLNGSPARARPWLRWEIAAVVAGLALLSAYWIYAPSGIQPVESRPLVAERDDSGSSAETPLTNQDSQAPPAEQAHAVPPEIVSEPRVIDHNGPREVELRAEATTDETGTEAMDRPAALKTKPRKSRVVVSFQLPRSGARLIWINDSEVSGGVE